MIFYFIRHGDPIYSPDSLTPLGVRQAEALAKRLAGQDIDAIYSSTSNRAVMTAAPTCELLGKKPVLLDFANEKYAWEDFSMLSGDGKQQCWPFQDPETRLLLSEPEIYELGNRWYTHPKFRERNFGKGVRRIRKETDGFFSSLGYDHIPDSGKYRVRKSNESRIAFFAHQGFGLAFLSSILDIPYPMFCTRFNMCHTGMTVIEFKEEMGYAIPRVLMLSSDSHLYKEGLPLRYNNERRI